MNSRKWAVTLAALGMICMIPTVGMADNHFELPGIGSMKLPAGVTVAEGAQATLNAVNECSVPAADSYNAHVGF